jgi:hypothetical protein
MDWDKLKAGTNSPKRDKQKKSKTLSIPGPARIHLPSYLNEVRRKAILVRAMIRKGMQSYLDIIARENGTRPV